MNTAKIRLSKKEKDLIINTDWILTKNEILKKVGLLFENLVTEQQTILQKSRSFFPAEITITLPKISKGENYNGLPWRVLDYPRVFSRENICAIRTMFWWGNFFSITLHLSGKYKKQFETTVISAYPLFAKHSVYYCIHDDQWQHHFEKDNYIPCKQLSVEQKTRCITQKDFLKLALKFDLEKWNDMPLIMMEGYQKIAGMLA